MSVVILRAIAIEIWTSSEAANRHYHSALNGIASDEYLVSEAGRAVAQLLDGNEASGLPQDIVARFDALPAGQITTVRDFPVSPPVSVYKAASMGHRDAQNDASRLQQLQIAIRMMWFEAAWGGSADRGTPVYYVSSDATLAITRQTRFSSPLASGYVEAARMLSSLTDRFRAVMERAPIDAPRPFWTVPYVHPATRDSTITAFVPVQGAGGVILGYIAKDFSLDAFNRSDRSQNILVSGFSFFSRENTYAFGRNDATLRRVMSNPEYHAVLRDGSYYVAWRDGMLLIGDRSPSSSWRVVLSLSFAQIMAAHKLTLLLAAAMFSLGTAATVAGGLFVNRRLLRPAEQQSRALVESDLFGRTIFTLSPVGLVVIDLEQFSLLARNEPARDMIWIGEDDAADESGRIVLSDLARAFHGVSGESVEVSSRTGLDSDKRHFTLRFATTQYRQKSVVLCAIVDITERRRAEESLARAKRDADRANAGKSDFLATVSHEIRTPLHGTLAALELLSSSVLDEEQRTLVDMMDGSARNLLQLINDLLDFSKLGAGQLTLHERPFSLLDELESVARSFAASASEKDLNLRCFVSPEFQRDLLGDPVRISQIAANLLGNALKFTLHGSVDIHADLIEAGEPGERLADPLFVPALAETAAGQRTGQRAAQRPDRIFVRIRVVDTGTGIPPHRLDRLFTPFYQADDTELAATGTGLGLSIIRSLTHLMGGDIVASSVFGAGSTFTATLPLAWAGAPPAPSRLSASIADLPIRLCATDAEEREFWSRWILWHRATPYDTGIVAANAVWLVLPFASLPDERGHATVSMELLGSPRPAIRDGLLRVTAYSQRALLLALAEAAGRQPLPDVAGHRADEERYDLQIMIVEDHPVNRALLTRQIERFGCRALAAADGAAALALLDDGLIPDLILTDINMPGMTGYQLAHLIRAKGGTMPLFGVTADVINRDHDKAGDVMQGLLPKPLSLSVLAPVLRAVASAKRDSASVPDHASPLRGRHVPRFDPQTLAASLRHLMAETMDTDVEHLTRELSNQSETTAREVASILHRMRGATLALSWQAMSELINHAQAALPNENALELTQQVIDAWKDARREWVV